jgi:chaperonin GroES
MGGIMFQPLGDRVLIKPLPAEEKTKSGIYIPDSAKEEKNEGEVIALGNGKMSDGKTHEFSVKKGDLVAYGYGSTIKIDGEDYKIVKEEDILGIIK